MIRLFLAGQKGVGKTTAAGILARRYGAAVYVLAKPIYQICETLYGMTGKDRSLLQKVGDALRSIDPEVFCKYALRVIEHDAPAMAVIEDVRYKNEADFFAAHGFTGIKLTCREEVRAERLAARNGESSTDTHPSEVEAQGLALPVEIDNSGSLEDLEAGLARAVEKIAEEQDRVRRAIEGLRDAFFALEAALDPLPDAVVNGLLSGYPFHKDLRELACEVAQWAQRKN
ncbi:MAG: AAA family ATPase [Firmicutes bacterium]|nr:AAA family ATPase [Bacillota bacterium]